MNHLEPFFILANPRSGSSLLRIICDCNDFLTVPPESGFLVWCKSKYISEEPQKFANHEFLNTLVKDIISSRKFETWKPNELGLFQFMKDNNPQNYSEAGSLVYYWYAAQQGKSPVIWGDKNNYYIHHLEELIELYPKAKFIHLIRDGRDVACSYLNLKKIDSSSEYFPKLTDDIKGIAIEWSDNNSKIQEFVSKLPLDRYLTVKYEQLIKMLEPVCISICNFLEVPFDDKMLRYDQLNRKNNIEPRATLDWKMKTLSRPDPSRIGQYRNQLSESDLEVFHQYARVQLREYGYV